MPVNFPSYFLGDSEREEGGRGGEGDVGTIRMWSSGSSYISFPLQTLSTTTTRFLSSFPTSLKKKKEKEKPRDYFTLLNKLVFGSADAARRKKGSGRCKKKRKKEFMREVKRSLL